MPTARFDAVLHAGHKDNAAEVPFDPGERWAIAAQALRPGRRGFRVHASFKDIGFETAIVARSCKFWLLVPADVAQAAGISVGESIPFAVSPLPAPGRQRSMAS